MEELNYDEVHDYYENYNWQTGEQDIPVFTGEYINSKLASMQIAEDLQNHLVFDHSYTDYLTISLVIINIIATIYLFHKLNTKSNG